MHTPEAHTTKKEHQFFEPVEIQHLKLKGLGNALQFRLGPREDYLYVVTQRGAPTIPLGEGNTLHVLRVHPHTGKLTERGNSFVKLQVPPGTRPQGVAAGAGLLIAHWGNPNLRLAAGWGIWRGLKKLRWRLRS